MRDRQHWHYASLVLATSVLAGCTADKQLHYVGKANMEHYQEVATSIAYPDVHEPTDETALATYAPRTVRDPNHDEVRKLSLSDAVHMALERSAVIRTRTQFLSPANPLYASPDRIPSIYDPAITETGVLFTGIGVEPALSVFDTTFSTSMDWGRNESAQNNFFLGGGLLPGNSLIQETGNFSAQLQKIFASGGQLSLRQNWLYSGTNVPFQLFPSAYTGAAQAEFRQPLWAGAGTDYTRTAGPVVRSIPGVTGVGQGVVVARINTDVSIADFEAAVINMVKDVEDLYWELYLNYRSFDAEKVAEHSALSTWRDTKTKLQAGRGNEADEAQALENYFAAKLRAENALANLYSTETQMRRMIGLPLNDGTILQPIDDPVVAEFSPDWQMSLIEALTRRVELRRQKWMIKSLELQLQAAESLTNPRLDFVSSYRVNGFGNDLFGTNDNDGRTGQGFNSAYEALFQGNQTGWGLGFEFSMPIGFRAAHAQVRHLELRLAKFRVLLANQEKEISLELGNAFQMMDAWYQSAETNFNRRIAAERQLAIYQEAFGAGRISIDLVVRSQSQLAQADVSYFTSIARYNQAINELFFRSGTLLAENNIHLAESNWTPEAYRDSLRHAVARSYAIDAKHLHAEPAEFAIPDQGYNVPMSPGISDPNMMYAEPVQSSIPPLPDLEFSPPPATDDNFMPPAIPPPEGDL